MNTGRDRVNGIEQFVHTDALARYALHHRHAQLLLELLGVDRDAVSAGLVDEIQEDHNPVSDLPDLEH